MIEMVRVQQRRSFIIEKEMYIEERVGFNAVYVPAGETKISSVME
jgi:hypothetical protein